MHFSCLHIPTHKLNSGEQDPRDPPAPWLGSYTHGCTGGTAVECGQAAAQAQGEGKCGLSWRLGGER
eukprot:1157303-Pelagomonas_calceolata.AAC.4